MQARVIRHFLNARYRRRDEKCDSGRLHLISEPRTCHFYQPNVLYSHLKMPFRDKMISADYAARCATAPDARFIGIVAARPFRQGDGFHAASADLMMAPAQSRQRYHADSWLWVFEDFALMIRRKRMSSRFAYNDLRPPA